MKKQLLLPFLWLSVAVNAQQVADFENIPLDPESFNNGSDLSGGFTSGDAFFPNEYDAENFFWTGWSISNTTDVTTPGFMNQYSAITGAGLNSSNYGTAFQSFITGETKITFGQETMLSGFYITNSTYAYLSMLNGDSFAKKFGGLTGNDPDFFLLTIRAFTDGNVSEESVEFYLADFRFEDNSQDYIVDEWTFVDLTTLGSCDSLSFSLTSSDVGEFGMNTPAYFCIDDFGADDQLSVTTNEERLFSVFPNPTSDWLRVHSSIFPSAVRVFDLNGKLLHSEMSVNSMNVSDLESGVYLLEVIIDQKRSTDLFIKK